MELAFHGLIFIVFRPDGIPGQRPICTATPLAARLLQQAKAAALGPLPLRSRCMAAPSARRWPSAPMPLLLPDTALSACVALSPGDVVVHKAAPRSQPGR
jgi:hypothetical protein